MHRHGGNKPRPNQDRKLESRAPDQNIDNDEHQRLNPSRELCESGKISNPPKRYVAGERDARGCPDSLSDSLVSSNHPNNVKTLPKGKACLRATELCERVYG